MESVSLKEAIDELCSFIHVHKLGGLFIVVIGKDGKTKTIAGDHTDELANALIGRVKKAIADYKKTLV